MGVIEHTYCHVCEKGLEEDEEFYCDGFGEHLCLKCYNKLKKKQALNLKTGGEDGK